MIITGTTIEHHTQASARIPGGTEKKSVLRPSPKEVPISAARSPASSCKKKGSSIQSIVSLYIEVGGEFPS